MEIKVIEKLKKLFSRSIKTKMTLITMSLFLSAILLISLYITFALKNDMEKLIGENQYSIACLLAEDIRQELEERSNSITFLASKITQEMINNPKYLQRMMDSWPLFTTYFNSGGVITGLSGVGLAEVPKVGRIGIPHNDREYIKDALNGFSTITGPFVGKIVKGPILIITSPIKNKNNKVIGVIWGTTDLSKHSFLSKMQEGQYGKRGSYLLINSITRTIIFSSDKNRIMEVLPKKGVNPFIDRAVDGWEGTGLAHSPKGDHLLVSIKPITGSHLYIATLIPADDVFAPVYEMQKRIFFITLVIVIIVGVIIWFVLKHQLKPIFNNIEIISNITDESSPLPITGEDEISELLQAFNNLLSHIKENKERFEKSFKISPYSIVISDPLTGEILDANNTFYETTGYNKKETTQYTLNLWENIEDRNSVIEELKKNNRILSKEYNFKTINGNKIVGLYSANLIEMHGKTYVLSSINDITENKRIEQENNDLKIKLAHSEKMEAIGTLAGGIAHDFNNLLMGIQGCASIMLLTKEETDPDYFRLTQIEEQVDRGSYLTKQLLGFARGGKYDLRPTNINLILNNTISLFERTKKDVIVHKKLDEDICIIESDRGQMEQVFMNLFVNAGQAMPAGGDLIIETKNEKKYIKISVTDTGIGMDEKTKAKIFEPFFTTKEMGRGTGLGLASVYGIVYNHKGKIDVKTEIGKGTTFNIYFPISNKKIEFEEIEKPLKEIIKGTESILIIDDEEIVLEMGVTILKHLGYEIYSACNGKDGIDVFIKNKEKISLIILDMIMPGMTGEQTFNKIREIDPDIKILLCSGFSIDQLAQSIINKSSGFIQKPYKIKEISDKIVDIIKL